MLGRDTPPTPLQRGGWNAAFFVDNECVVCGVSPSQRGDEGVCYGEERGIG